jgi:hypothetical protein
LVHNLTVFAGEHQNTCRPDHLRGFGWHRGEKVRYINVKCLQ